MLIRSVFLKSAAAAVLGLALVAGGVAYAQQARDPAYSAARANGQVGEKMDGYLGVVGSVSAEVTKMVRDLNLLRKGVFFTKAQEQRVTPEEYGFTTGCKQIMRTAIGEKYEAPDGSWKTRTAEPPQMHSKCP